MKKRTMKRQVQHRSYSKNQVPRQLSFDSAIIAACIIRFKAIYPSTEIEDWFQLIETEAFLFSISELKFKLEPLIAAKFFQENEQRKRRGMPELFSTGLPCGDMDRIHEILLAVVEFVDAFTLVFDYDWDNTRCCIINANECKIDDTWFGKNGTFAYPKISDISSNWCNRGHLLSSYSKLLNLLGRLENNIYQPNEPS